MKLYEHENGNKMIIDNDNLVSVMEREGYKYIGECDEKGKLKK